jgi:hypothetical protein
MATRWTDIEGEPTGEAIVRRSTRVGLRRAVSLFLGLLALERTVDLDQRLLLSFGDRAIAQDVADEVLVRLALFEETGAYVERLGGDPERAGDRLEDLGTRLAKAALDLTQIGIRDPGELAQLPQ